MIKQSKKYCRSFLNNISRFLLIPCLLASFIVNAEAKTYKPKPNETFKEPVEENIKSIGQAPSDKKDVYRWQTKDYKSITSEYPNFLEHTGQPQGNPKNGKDVLRWQKAQIKDKRNTIEKAVKKK